jgi:hypothetical protein
VSSNGSAITVTTASFTASSISFYKNGNNDANLTTITVNGTAYTFPLQSTATGWVTVNLGSEVTVTSLTTTWYGGYTLYAVKADNKLLVDSGVSVANVPSIASTVRANPSAGFSIVSYTGAGAIGTIGHGLNAVPGMMIVKSRDTENWHVYHKGLDPTAPQDYYVRLNTTGARSNYDGFWNDTAPTSSVFTVGSDGGTSGANDFIAYCFAPVEGYSAMGSYVGNGSADGPFVFTGFRPRWILGKATTTTFATGDWFIYDTERETFNSQSKPIGANTSNVEDSGGYYYIDVLSNGFKIRGQYDMTNKSAETYIWVALAENPFKTARAR